MSVGYRLHFFLPLTLLQLRYNSNDLFHLKQAFIIVKVTKTDVSLLFLTMPNLQDAQNVTNGCIECIGVN